MPFDVMHQTASRRQRRAAAGLGAALVLSVLAVLPMASVKLPALPQLTGIYGSSAAMIDFAVYWLLRSTPQPSRPLSIIAAAYLYAGLAALLHMLTFPGALLSEGAVVGDGDYSSWVFLAWRTGFPAFMIWAVLSDEADSPARGPKPSLAAVFAAAGCLPLAMLASRWPVPESLDNLHRFGPHVTYGAYASALLSGVALVLIVRRGLMRRSVYLWLSLVLVAEAAAIWLSTRSGSRYTVAWYAARAEGLMANTIMLAVLGLHYREIQARLKATIAQLSHRTDALQAEMQHRERAERLVAQAQKLDAVGQLAAGLAHDINNFLQVIALRTEMIRRRLGPAAEADVEVVQRNVRKTEHLTRQLLSFAGRRQLHPQVVPLAQHVPEFLTFFQSVLGPRVSVHLDLAQDAWPVRLDPSELETALANLLSNARDAMSGEGHVHLRLSNRPGAHPEADQVVLEVQDEGSGIPAAVLERVFEPFFTTKPPGKGSGLGLAQVYAFVKGCSGDVALSSQAGQGTTVRLSFPRHQEARQDQDVAAREASPMAGRVVLLVDDNKDILDSTSALLSLHGLVVKTAGSVAEAWQQLDEGLEPDLVISDIVMAGARDGVDLAEQLRRARPGLRVVLASAYSAAAAEAAALGHTVLRKPYGAGQLLQAIAGRAAATQA